MPSECNYEEELNQIFKIQNDLERCLNLFCYIQRSQMFQDGNKRVANLVSNKEMIRCGQGIISIPVDKIGEYFTRLIKYYESNDNSELINWLYDNAIDGV